MRTSSHRSRFLALALAAMLCSGCGSGSASSGVQRRLLSGTGLPAGWATVTSTTASSAKLTNAPCLSGLAPKGLNYATASFVQGTSIPSLGEDLSSGPQVHRTWQRLERALARCRKVTVPLGRLKVRASVRPLAFPSLGATTSAYAFAFTLAGIRLGFDLVLFETARYGGYLVYSDLGGPQLATVKAFVEAAVVKATKGSTARIPNTVSVASAPVMTADTELGKVGYRVVGAGPPLVLIMGYAGTMEVWDRRLVDALAQHNRIVIFDNAGIGKTQALPAPLTIDAMANQTSALIKTLGLGRVDVLGWSMGSMIAQALTVLHPTQVRRLVLAASYPGNGTTVQPSQRAINALKSSREQTVMADLFPADQSGAENSYLVAGTSYPSHPSVPAATVTAQAHAIKQWWNGTDPAGGKPATIKVPTLIADGSLDRLDASANSRILAMLIRGARLKLYRDAGHAFLFQDQTTFIPMIESFLGR